MTRADELNGSAAPPIGNEELVFAHIHDEDATVGEFAHRCQRGELRRERGVRCAERDGPDARAFCIRLTRDHDGEEP